ncbi:hypothetical protein [uncultured Fusobacterium sp.]|uniref:hypothetical protein n=1 Tax=uncultured Fusobacterium sp. TaxID=159267 RepID=UPI00265DC89F|nr:hypothetical protein [uncultured Fusobacterium sp.]
MGEIDPKEKKKILKKKKEIRNLRKQQKRENARKRKERKIKLIKLGTLFRILDLLDEKQEIMLGFLEKYLKLTITEKEKLRVIGDKILSENKLKSYDDDLNDRKKMFYLMIRKAALLEKLNIHLEDPRIILGFLNKYKDLTKDEKLKLEERGKELFTPSEKKTLGTTENEEATDKQKVEVLIYLQNKKIDSTKFLKERYNTSIHGLKRIQAEEIIKSLNKKAP